MTSGGSPVPASAAAHFDELLWVFHYHALRAACRGVDELQPLAAKVSVALLRHADLIPADRAFYEAGSDARALGWDSLAFVLLNRFLDVADLVEEESRDAAALDNTDFEGTDIPHEKLLIPDQPCVSNSQREQAKEWVLAVSLDQRIEQVRNKRTIRLHRNSSESSMCFKRGSNETNGKCRRNCRWTNGVCTRPLWTTGKCRSDRCLAW